MADSRQPTSTLDDDLHNDFLIDDAELDLDLDEPESAPRGRSGRRSASYRPVRMRRTPNWSRIATAVFVGFIGVLVLYFGISSWRSHARTSAYERYFGQVSDITNQSNTEGKELDSMLTQNGGIDRAQIVAQLQKLERRAGALVTDARQLDVPKQLAASHTWLILTLEYRQRAFEQLRKGMTGALATRDQSVAAASLSDAMARMLTSDVIYQDSYQARARAVLKADDVTGVTVPESVVLNQRDAVTTKGMQLILDRLRSNRITTSKSGKVKIVNDGKTHGGQLDQVTISPSGNVLSSDAVNEISGSDQLAFEVSFTNQGDVQETKIPVVITLSSDANPSVEMTGMIDVVDPGQTGSVTIPVDDVPAFGTTFDMKVMVGPVPGEKTVDNNGATYQVTFRL